NSAVTADFNNDGRSDLAVADYGGRSVTVLLGNGNGTFQNGLNSSADSNNPVGLGVADFDGGGNPDLGGGDISGNQVAVLPGNGDGTFRSSVLSNAGPAASFLTVGDFNGDGLPDVAVADLGGNTVAVLLNQPAQASTFVVAGYPSPAVAG